MNEKCPTYLLNEDIIIKKQIQILLVSSARFHFDKCDYPYLEAKHILHNFQSHLDTLQRGPDFNILA